MLVDEMPCCLCFKLKQGWRPGGSQMGNGSYHWFTCTVCGRVAVWCYFGTSVLLVTNRTNAKEMNLAEQDYINGPLKTAMRFRRMRLDQARAPIENRLWDCACDAVGVPRGTKFDQVPPELQERFLKEGDYDEHPKWMKPPGFIEIFLPPQLPVTLSAFTTLDAKKGWYAVSREASMAMPVPLDPIRIEHDKEWEEIFDALEPLGVAHRSEIRNEYCDSGHEPWYSFVVNDTMFTVGPRHSVVHVQAAFPHAVDVSTIEVVATRDKVTSEWCPTGGIIHAWNKFRLVEYLTILIEMAKRPAVAKTA